MINWNQHWLNLAKEISLSSKDPRTQVGCVIIGPDREIRTTGYNRLPRGAKDDAPERQIRPEKLFWFEHAERNAIYDAARVGIPLKDSRAYVTLCPCMDCARGLIQSGVIEVFCPKPDLEKYQMWAEQFKRAEILYKECNVELVYL